MEESESQGESMPKLDTVRLGVIAGAVIAALNLGLLFMLGMGGKCEVMASGVMYASTVGVASLLLPIAFSPAVLVLAVKRYVSYFAFVALVLYYAILVPTLVYLPPWQKIVPNVRTAYAEFMEKCPERKDAPLTREAEWAADLTKPVFDWLAK